MTLQAIKACSNSVATGPDGLTMLHIKHLGPRGLQYLTHLFTLSLRSADIPAIWKQAAIIPIPKAGKPADLGTSYRPISLLCPAAKVMEKLLLPQLTNHLQLADSQHGFRRQRSTISALLPLAHKVATGFNKSKPADRTVLMAIDFSKAFDTVNHTKLLQAVSNSTLPHNTVRWLVSYLRGRSAFCRYNRAASVCHAVRTGVPQGSAISPLLFNFFVSTYPDNAELQIGYADDVHAAASSVNPQTAATSLTAHAEAVGDWARERDLQISAPKSHVTLFTPHSHQAHLHPSISLQGSPLPLERHPKLLGVTFDTQFTFSPHIQSIVERASDRLKILKALSGTTWGQHKETITITYKALVWSLLTYAAPVWSPNISQTNLNRLQTIQNSALRIATGCHSRASQGHLHTETKVLPIEDSLNLLCRQYLVSALCPSHPSHAIVTAPSGRRPMKNTLQSKHLRSVRTLLTDTQTPLSPEQAATIQQKIHTKVVQDAIRKAPPNRVLRTAAPEINPEETTLPRVYRTTLSQLRSGHCKALNEYRRNIGLTHDRTCPDCGSGATHSTSHLFACAAHPTDLVVRDLWDRPALAARFLSTVPSFHYLPPLPPPPPEPPPPGAAL